MNKRSQMEVFGLAVIVILLVIGMVFMIAFVVKQKPMEFKTEVKNSKIASFFVSSLLETNMPDCQDIKMRDIFTDCAAYTSEKGTILCEGAGLKSCYYIKQKMPVFLSVLKKWKIMYNFKATEAGSVTKYIYEDNTCTGKFDKQLKQFPLPTDSGPMVAVLEICTPVSK